MTHTQALDSTVQHSPELLTACLEAWADLQRQWSLHKNVRQQQSFQDRHLFLLLLILVPAKHRASEPKWHASNILQVSVNT